MNLTIQARIWLLRWKMKGRMLAPRHHYMTLLWWESPTSTLYKKDYTPASASAQTFYDGVKVVDWKQNKGLRE